MTVVVFTALASGASDDYAVMRAGVGALLRARTKIPNGGELGTFTDKTRPTAVQVDVLIDQAIEDVVAQIGVPEVGAALEEKAQRAAALYAAVLVEASFYPEQVASGRSPADLYEKLYENRMKALVAYVAQGGEDPDNADGAAGAAEADLSFDTQWVDAEGVLRGQPIVGYGSDW